MKGACGIRKNISKRLHSGLIMKKSMRHTGLVGLEMDTSLTHTKDKGLSSWISQPP